MQVSAATKLWMEYHKPFVALAFIEAPSPQGNAP
jgi:hypothetical protein